MSFTFLYGFFFFAISLGLVASASFSVTYISFEYGLVDQCCARVFHMSM